MAMARQVWETDTGRLICGGSNDKADIQDVGDPLLARLSGKCTATSMESQ